MRISERLADSVVKMTVYKKSGCPWAAAVIAFLNELGVGHEVKNVTTQRVYAKEVEEKSGKCISPTVEVDGEIVADASVEDVAELLEKRGIVI
jgi:glutaredoxin